MKFPLEVVMEVMNNPTCFAPIPNIFWRSACFAVVRLSMSLDSLQSRTYWRMASKASWSISSSNASAINVSIGCVENESFSLQNESRGE